MGKAPLTRTFEVPVEALGAAVDGSVVLFKAPWAGTVTSVTYATVSAITGADTNTRTVAVVNKGASGSGSTSVASLALTSGVNTVAFDEKAITLSATAADLVLAANDVVAWTSTHAASGLADPGGTVFVTISRTA